MTGLIEGGVLTAAGEFLSWPGVVDDALAEAGRHQHRAFLWSVQHRRNIEGRAQGLIDEALAEFSAVHPTRARLVAALKQTTARPIVRDGWVHINNTPRYITKRPERVLAIWDLLHLVEPLMCTLRTGPQLDSSDPAEVFRYFYELFRPDRIQARAVEIESALELVKASTATGI